MIRLKLYSQYLLVIVIIDFSLIMRFTKERHFQYYPHHIL